MLNRCEHRAAPGAEASPVGALPRPDWLKPHRLDYMPLDEQRAVVRLVAQLRGCLAPPAAALLVEGPEALFRTHSLGSLTHSVPRRFRPADELLWRATFAVPLELVECPDAMFSILGRGYAPACLPDPALATLAALSQPWPVGPRGAMLLNSDAWRRAAAMGTVIAVAGTSSVSPALAGASRGASGQTARIHPPRGVTIVHTSSQSSSSTTGPAPGSSSGAPVQLSPEAVQAGTPDGPRSAKQTTSRRKKDSAARSKPAAKPAQAPSSTSRPPATKAGPHGTDPGSKAARPSPAALLAAEEALRNDKSNQSGGAPLGGGALKLSGFDRGSAKSPGDVSIDQTIGRLQPAKQGSANHTGGHRHRRGTVPVRGAHPLHNTGGGHAAPKPLPPPAPSSSGSGSPGGNQFSTGAPTSTVPPGPYSEYQPPAFLIPIYERAGAQFNIPWAVLAAINSIESDYGRNMSTSSAGAIGWMQFMPSTWAQYGMAVGHKGPPNPYNPTDAIFSAARYLAANGGGEHLSQAIYAYNHAQWYVAEVLSRAHLINEYADVSTPMAPGPITGKVLATKTSSFVVRSQQRVISALTTTANMVARLDYPYVYGGGHAQAGTPSVGEPGPGYNGHSIGYDCSGSVAAVLAGGGLWRKGSSVPADDGIIAQLRAEHLIAPGVGRGPVEVTLYDDPGVHIFMNINGRFFGTTAGAALGNPAGGPGWLPSYAPNATSPAYHPWHILPGVLMASTHARQNLTFRLDKKAGYASALAPGETVKVTYKTTKAGLATTAIGYPHTTSASGAITSVARDGKSFTIQAPGGKKLTMASGRVASTLPTLMIGQAVKVTYTASASGPVALAVTETSPPPYYSPALGQREAGPQAEITLPTLRQTFPKR